MEPFDQAQHIAPLRLRRVLQFNVGSLNSGDTILVNPSLHWTFASPHIQAQLELFYGAVREAYDTTGWPEQTYWERALAYSGVG